SVPFGNWSLAMAGMQGLDHVGTGKRRPVMSEGRNGVLRVYYDGICPGCRRDRARYERWAGEAGDRVAWCDVTEHQATLREKGVDPQAALLSLHVEEEGGRILEGIDA